MSEATLAMLSSRPILFKPDAMAFCGAAAQQQHNSNVDMLMTETTINEDEAREFAHSVYSPTNFGNN